MAFCAHCGAALTQESGFCGGCGKPIGGTAQPAAAIPQAVPAGTASAIPAQAIGSSALAPNLAGALAYILGLITGVLFLVLEPYKNDRFVRFHAMQSILFSVACIAFSIALSIVTGMLIQIVGFMALVIIPIRMLIGFGIFLFWLYVMYQAYSQREYHIPFIGDIAAKQVPS